MGRNLTPELLSIAILCILWVYARKGNLIPSFKNRIFQASFAVTLAAMVSNVLTAVLVHTLSPSTLLLAWLSNLVCYLTTPLIGMTYYLYTLSNIYEGRPGLRRHALLACIPGLLFAVAVLLTPYNHMLFSITLDAGYAYGAWVGLTYAVFCLYAAACAVLLLRSGHLVAPTIRRILLAFPILSAFIMLIQLRFPSAVLSGSAATCILLLIYLFLQNKQIGTDYLTQLPNRLEFLSLLELSLHRGNRFTVLVFSLRQFKSVNDTHGQLNGDKLLSSVADYLRKSSGLREGEIFRYSGDEFALLIKDADSPHVAALVERLTERMRRPWETPGCACLLNAVIGLVSCPGTASQKRDLLTGLEYAVSAAKRGCGRSCVCYCTPQLLDMAKRRCRIAELLEYNLAHDGFEVHYQPIYSIAEQSFVKAEALLRMSDPELGDISPAEFIPVAEERGLIIDITYLVLKKVARYIRRLLDAGFPLSNISVNFSALQFAQYDLLPRLTKLIQDSGIPPSTLKIELTESTLSENSQLVASVIHQLHHLGIHIGLDDFGTGYSNLISVLGLPIDTVKLDKSLIWSAMDNDRFAIAVHNFARAFRELGMDVLAEGVETDEQLQFSVTCGCTFIQGFLYSRPLPPAQFEAFLGVHIRPCADGDPSPCAERPHPSPSFAPASAWSPPLL